MANATFHTVAEQVLLFNNNITQMLSQLNNLFTSDSSSLTINYSDFSGVVTQYTIPSFGYIQGEINRLNNNVNSLFNISSSGATIQSGSSSFQKVVTVDLNSEPANIPALTMVSSFVANKNWVFDTLVDPELYLQLDLTGLIDSSVRKVLSRRYIVEFDTDINGNLTQLGQSALNSFNNKYRNVNNIDYNSFLTWYASTPGLLNSINPNYDEKKIDLEPNALKYNGIFSVLKTEEDTINNILYYHVNTLNYLDNTNNSIKQLAVNDELIINVTNSSTKYLIIEISMASSNPRLVLQRVEGNNPIPIGSNTLKLYSPVLNNYTIQVPFGYNERSVLFTKAINMDTYIESKNWSPGYGFWTNDLNLASNDSNNGTPLTQYYVNNVNDYGKVLKGLVVKNISNSDGLVPNIPILNVNDFQIVQTNTNLTSTSDSDKLKNLNNQLLSLNSEIEQINAAIQTKNNQLQINRFTSDSAKKQFQNEIVSLNNQKASKTTLLTSVTNQIVSLSNSPNILASPEFSVRGFWAIPNPVSKSGVAPQYVIQFEYRYKKLDSNGKEMPIDSFNISSTNTKAAFSNWINVKTDIRKRVYDSTTGTYTWQIEDVTNPDVNNINQLDIPVKYGEQVEIQVRAISEVGWPDTPIYSDWGSSVIIPFPTSLNQVTNQSSSIINNANKQEVVSTVLNELESMGVNDLLSEKSVINNQTYYFNSNTILSGFKDSNGNSIGLFDYLTLLQNRILVLENTISQAIGDLTITIFKNSEQFVVTNGSSLSFNLECEDYLTPYVSNNTINTGRVYQNNIYVIKDFMIKISNNTTSSKLGLLSNRLYNSGNTDVYQQTAPQVFWVDSQNNLITNDQSGISKTQLDNQFIWSVNYDNITSSTITKLSDNVGSTFLSSNSITNILGSNNYNIGYSDQSILSFKGNNKSLLDTTKWLDDTVSVASTTKLLSSVHPVIDKLSSVIETNSSKTHTIGVGVKNDINIPINIYFKMNALDNTQSGLDYNYIDLNQKSKTITHTKELKILVDSLSDNRPTIFSIKFNLNRSKIIVGKNSNQINITNG
jgi:hypothetical protein